VQTMLRSNRVEGLSSRSAMHLRSMLYELTGNFHEPVTPEHVAIINRVLTPSNDEIARARAIVRAFDNARARGESSVEVDGSLVEMPTWLNATRLLARARDLGCD